MRDLSQIWTSRIPREVCETIILQAEELPAKQGVIGHGGETAANAKIRRSTIRWIPRLSEFGRIGEWDYLWRTIDYLFQEGNRNAFDVDYDHGSPQSLQYTEYFAEDEGHYDWHQDLHWICEKQPKQRKLSAVINLVSPDDYDGGLLEIAGASLDPTKMRALGTVIMFPSMLMHRVTPVTRGKRITLVAWAEGRPYR